MQKLLDLSMSVKIAIGLGLLLVIGLIVYLVWYRKSGETFKRSVDCKPDATPTSACIAEAYRVATNDMRVFLEGIIMGPDINKLNSKDVSDLKQIAVDLNQKEANPQTEIAPAIQNQVKTNKDLSSILLRQAAAFKNSIQKKVDAALSR